MYLLPQQLLDDLQGQAHELEAQYEQLLASNCQQDSQPTPALTYAGANEEDAESPNSSLHRTYVELAKMNRALTKENAALRLVWADYLAMEKQIQQLSNAQNKAVSTLLQEQAHK